MKLSYETISIELTKRCNLECKYCYSRVNEEDEKQELSSDKIKSFLKRFRENSGRRVLFTGGEALLRTDFKELVLYAKSIGLIVDLFSNGTLIDEEYAQFISENINLVNISLDGPVKNHDEVRCVKGSYEKTYRALEYLNICQAHFALQCMFTSENYEDLSWLKDVMNNTHPLMVKLGHVSKMGRGRNQEQLWLSEEEILNLKKIAGRISENYSNFHTRVMTNIITRDELLKFYPSLENVLTPWLLPSGKIISCYVDENIDDWMISDVNIYPECNESVKEKTKMLETKIHKAILNNKYFDLLEIAAIIAGQMKVEG